MADSVTGIKVFTMAQLRTKSAGANQIGDTGIDGVVRSAWNQRAAVAVSDHPADNGDGNERAVFVSESHNNIWRLGGAKLGTVKGTTTGPDIIVPV